MLNVSFRAKAALRSKNESLRDLNRFAGAVSGRPRTAGGSGAPEPLPVVGLETTERAPEPRPRWVLRAGAHAAERGGEVVHGEAVGAKLVRGGEMLANVAGGNRRGVGEARENEQAVGGEFARIFRRGIVARRQGAGQHLDEARTGRRLQPTQGFDFAGRDEARDRHPAVFRLFDDFANGLFVLGDALLECEAHMKEKGRAEQGEIAQALPAARRQALQKLRVDVGVAEKAVGVRELPELTRRVELDVMANGAQHRRDEGEFDVAAAVEAGETQNRRGRLPPNPCGGEQRGNSRVTPKARGVSGVGAGDFNERDIARKAALALEAVDFGGDGAGLFERLAQEGHHVGQVWGFGGVPPMNVGGGVSQNCRGLWRPRTLPVVMASYFSPTLLDRAHERVAREERVEVGRDIVVDDQDEVKVIGHDHEVAQRRGGPGLVHGHESGLYDFAECRELWPMMLVDKFGKHFGAAFKRKRDEEESLAGVGEGEIHSGVCLCLCMSETTDEVYTNVSCSVKLAA